MSKDGLTPDEAGAVGARRELVDKWGADTISLFKSNIRTDGLVDILCITTLSVCSTYFKAIMILLENGLRMPTKALLRILYEVSVKVLWCLAKRGTDDSKSAIEGRVNGWAKNALEEDVKLRRDLLGIVPEVEELDLQKSIDESQKMLEEWQCVTMPNRFYSLSKELGDDWSTSFYPQLYRRFNDAVHLDFASLCTKADLKRKVVTNDSNEPIEELAQYSVLSMHFIFVAIRGHYGWDIEEMEKEFEALTRL